MRDALEAVLAGRAALAFPRAAADLAGLRPAAGESKLLLLIIMPDVPAIDRAMLLAAVGPLAVDLAPDVRIAAIVVAPDATVADVAEAAGFLATAESTTGQTVRITPR